MSNKIKPRCPVCNKALYRTSKPKEKRETESYVFCRNETCALYGDINKISVEPTTVLVEPSAQSTVERNERRIRAAYAKSQSSTTRKAISKAIKDSKTRSITVITVVVMLQELGENDVANTLIERYNLGELYGLIKSTCIN